MALLLGTACVHLVLAHGRAAGRAQALLAIAGGKAQPCADSWLRDRGGRYSRLGSSRPPEQLTTCELHTR